MADNPEMPARRHTFLVRCWSEETVDLPQGGAWRFSLERVDGPSKRTGFANLHDLVVFIEADLERHKARGFVAHGGEAYRRAGA